MRGLLASYPSRSSFTVREGVAPSYHRAGVIEGKAYTAYPAVGPDVKNAGGKWMEIPVDKAHVDGNLVAAPAWPAHPEWLAKFLKVLGTKI